jgi:peptidoglycan/LPS O-acetylase OafA/YrhL
MGASLNLINIKPNKYIFILSLFILLVIIFIGKDFGYKFYGIPRTKILIGKLQFPRSLVWGIPCTLFLSQFLLFKRLNENVASNFFVFIGDISYELYLLQVPYFWFLNRYFFKIQSPEIKVIVLILSILTLFIFSKFLKKFINYSWKLI